MLGNCACFCMDFFFLNIRFQVVFIDTTRVSNALNLALFVQISVQTICDIFSMSK